MRAFVDTNILIDYLCRREPFFLSAKAIFASCYIGKIEIVLSSLSIVNILYICRKQNLEALKLSLLGLSQYIEIVDLPSCMVLKGLRSNWDDYEDFLQHETAIANNCNCILTRNIEDFSKSSLPIYSPEDFMKLIV